MMGVLPLVSCGRVTVVAVVVEFISSLCLISLSGLQFTLKLSIASGGFSGFVCSLIGILMFCQLPLFSF